MFAESLYIFPCQWNYRPDHCMYGSNCKGAEQEGVSILHGNRGVYHDDKQPAFKVVYDAIHAVRIIYSFEWIVSLTTASFFTRLPVTSSGTKATKYEGGGSQKMINLGIKSFCPFLPLEMLTEGNPCLTATSAPSAVHR